MSATKKTGVELIAEERQRQIEVEGWTKEHDAKYDDEELARAAACYATPKDYRVEDDYGEVPTDWPWHDNWWKPGKFEFSTDSNYVEERIRELVKAGGLIAAQIDVFQNLSK